MAKIKPHPYIATVERLYKELGQGNEIKASMAEITALIGENGSAVTRVLSLLKQKKAAHVRYYLDPNHHKRGGGRHSAWTLDSDLDTARGIVTDRFGATIGANHKGGRPRKASPSQLVKQLGEIKLKPAGAVLKSFSDLAPLRRDESHAFFEVARKHRDQQQFLTDERKRFADMGLTLGDVKSVYDESTLAELNAVVKVIPYVEGLERENERLIGQNKAALQPTVELNDLRRQVRSQRDQIERMVAEKAEQQEAVRELENDHRNKMKSMRDQYSQLEEINRQLKAQIAGRSIDSAIHRTNGTTVTTEAP